MTGAPVPAGADAVIRFEDCKEENDIVQFNVNSVSPNQNIARQGEDTTVGKLILIKNIKLDETAISSLAVTGKSNVSVYKLPRVTIVSTGNEIVPIDAIPLPYQIWDSNAYSLKSFLKQYNISQLNCIHISDDTEKLYETLPGYLDVDILILSGGVSKGEADYIPEVLTALGIKEIFHRVKIKPGNPLWFGQLPSGGVVFGLPGNPVSVQIGYKIFIEPFLRKCFLMEEHSPLYLPLLQERNKKTTFTEYFPCKLITRNGVTGLEPKKMNTSGDISATVGTDGIAVHPEETVMLKENTMVEFYFWNQ
jgi:molybdopterin molybdotransferase